jgi:serine/threonine protein phosphatase PrpC
MRTGLLLGRDHTRIGDLAALAEGRSAIALSRGGAAKTYDYRDPNEDACAFAYTDRAFLVAVADGHWGNGGAELALARILDRHAPRWLAPTTIALAERWSTEAPDVVQDLDRALVAAGNGMKTIGRTTLTLVVARPTDGWWSALCVGDSHLFEIDGEVVREHFPASGRGGGLFVGDPRTDRQRVESGTRAGVQTLSPTSCFLLATDGLSETGIGVADPGKAAAEAFIAARGGDDPSLRPLDAARALAECALESHREQQAGDNIATACLWLERS